MNGTSGQAGGRVTDMHANEERQARWPSNGMAHGGGLRKVIRIYREKVVLDLVGGLGLPDGSGVLEVGCGRESLALVLAQRNVRVTAVDRVQVCLNALRRRAQEAGLQDRILTVTGDVFSLGVGDSAFDLVLALGVVSWIGAPARAVAEIFRVLKPGGSVIFTVYNRWRLDHVLDPRLNPLLVPVWGAVVGLLEGVKLTSPSMKRSFPRAYSVREFDALLRSAGFSRSRGMTVAFGPFSLLGKRVMPDLIGRLLQPALQKLVEWNVPVIRSAGNHYMVVAQRPGLPYRAGASAEERRTMSMGVADRE